MADRRLTCEPLRPAHATTLFAHLQAPEIYAWIPEEPPGSIERLRARYGVLERGAPAGSGERWLNWVVMRDDRPIGTLQATVFIAKRTASVAYVLFPEHWGQGLAYEATRWMLETLSRETEIDTFEALIDARNVRSIALIERLDFRLVGHEATELGTDALYERSVRA